MEYLASVLLALLLNCTGIYIFSTPKICDRLPYMTYLIFLVSIFFLLWDVKFIPTAFRKLCFLADLIIEFLLAKLIMEFIANNFWFPLEMAVVTFLPRVPEFVAVTLQLFGYQCKALCNSLEFLKYNGTIIAVVYLFSIFFFLSIIHATRVVDFSLLICKGICKFIEDAARRGQALYENIMRMVKCKSMCLRNKSHASTIIDMAHNQSNGTSCLQRNSRKRSHSYNDDESSDSEDYDYCNC